MRNPSTRRHRTWLLPILVVALVAAACGGGDGGESPATTAPTTAAPGSTQGTEPGGEAGRPEIPVLRLAGGTDWGYPSPFGFRRGPGYVRASFIFDTLVWKEPDGTIIPWLAESWEMSDDGTQWVFQLRDDVRWQDGTPFTAEDVVFTLEYTRENPAGLPLRAASTVESIEATGDDEVTFTLTDPYAAFLTNIAAAMQIIPRHIWEGVEDPRSMRTPEAVVGTGPYRLEEYNQEDGSYLYVANPDFFLGEPAVKRIEFLPVANELLALAEGEIDAGGPGVQAGVTEDLLARFRQDPYRTLEAPGEWAMDLKFNMTKAPFDDVRFRQAVAYAIDRKDMVDRILLGQGVPGNPGWLSPANPWYNPNVPAYDRDPAKAEALLDEMGLVDTDGDGVRELPDGTPLSYELPYASFDSARNGELLQTYLAEVGIEVRPVALDRGIRDDRASTGDYDMILVGHGGLGSDPDFMRLTFHSKSKSKSFIRPHGFVNEEFDKVAGMQLRQLDPEARRELVWRMQEIIAEQLPVIPLYHPTRYWFYDSTVLDGWHYTSGGLAAGIPMALDKKLFVDGG